MPHVSDRFTAYPVRVTLDGSGNGSVTFQAVGQNLRVTNIYGSVSTRTAQATAAISKGAIGPQWSLVVSNSGSTGFNANGTISLLDGETIYVSWTGGDPGATATATFTGVVAPFDVVRNDLTIFTISDPIAAGDGSLIYPALRSPNFVTGVSGWNLSRDGDIELNAGTFRGSVSIRNPTSGRGVTINTTSGDISLYAEASALGLLNFPGAIQTTLFDNVISGRMLVTMRSGLVASGTPSQIKLWSSSATNMSDEFIELIGDVSIPSGNFTIGTVDMGRGFQGENSFPGNSAANAAEQEVFNVTPTVGFVASRLYRLDFDGRVNQTIAGNGPQIRLRENTIAGTNFVNAGRIAVNGNVEYAVPPPVYFKTGATVTSTSISVTITPSAGTAQWQGPRGVSLWDMGLASYRPNVPTIT